MASSPTRTSGDGLAGRHPIAELDEQLVVVGVAGDHPARVGEVDDVAVAVEPLGAGHHAAGQRADRLSPVRGQVDAVVEGQASGEGVDPVPVVRGHGGAGGRRVRGSVAPVLQRPPGVGRVGGSPHRHAGRQVSERCAVGGVGGQGEQQREHPDLGSFTSGAFGRPILSCRLRPSGSSTPPVRPIRTVEVSPGI